MFDLLSGPAFGAACALTSAFSWALTSLLVRRLGAVSHMMTINAVRLSIAGVALLALSVAGVTARAELASTSALTFAAIVFSTVLSAAIGDSIYFECTRILGLGRAMTLAMTYPLLAAIAAAVFLGEPITLRSTLGALTTLSGLVLIVSTRHADGGEHPGRRLAVLGSLFVACTWATSAIVMKPIMQELSPLTAQGLRIPLIALFLWLMPWTRAGVPDLYRSGRRVVAPMVVLTALTGVSSMSWIAGLKYSDVAVATVLSSTSPLFALALGALFLGEKLTPTSVAGAALTIAGIAIIRT